MSREAFRETLRRTITQQKHWPKKPDPHLKRDIPPHGWLLPVLLDVESLTWGRWDHWMRTMEAGRLLDEPIPPIAFAPHQGLARKMHEKSLEAVTRHGGWQDWDSWRCFDYYLGWLLYGFGDKRQPEPPPEPEEGAFLRLYQVFCLEAMVAWPADHFGDMLAENRHGRGAGFFPTPHEICEIMVRMQVGGGDNRAKSVCDPCVGTGRMLLHASNYSYRLYGQDINATVIKACLVNGYCFAPWLVRPFPFLHDQPEEKVSRAEEVSPPEPPSAPAPNRINGHAPKGEQMLLFGENQNHWLDLAK